MACSKKWRTGKKNHTQGIVYEAQSCCLFFSLSQICAPSLISLCGSLQSNVAQGAAGIVHVYCSIKNDRPLSAPCTHRTRWTEAHRRFQSKWNYHLTLNPRVEKLRIHLLCKNIKCEWLQMLWLLQALFCGNINIQTTLKSSTCMPLHLLVYLVCNQVWFSLV